ncbi:glycosyltransferase involved in cell wall biosynthesis [Lewinella marina]|uniref:Glycosyltransferase n=1 Tax=Neolewinella marina TaxID=438751 RepID=A0A2G0CC35_9BACT|nr:glycosyltransferase [Neolewinella marina]NJB86679.1 glycosyltransferase involved in cell wall biosynthesis [Neolewinella marina]PHK97487.1 hypothetical protein CGL56_15420 [Neolewinella marina]
MERLTAPLTLFTGQLDSKGTGREKFRHSTMVALREISADLRVFHFVYDRSNNYVNLLKFRLDGLHLCDTPEFRAFVDQIPETGTVVFDGSNYGTAVAQVRKRKPKVRIIVLYHNVESIFFYRAFVHKKNPKSLALAAYYYVQEWIVARKADACVYLTQEDLQAANRIYPSHSSAVLPIAVACGGGVSPRPESGLPLKLLFVGGAFYANVQAARWLATAISQMPNVKLTVVGKGFDGVSGLNKDNVSVYGFVDSLDPFYNSCDVVTNPIFSGSGMKTKVAEAMYYGKPILSTEMGLHGYDAILGQPYVNIFKDEFELAGLLKGLVEKKQLGHQVFFYPQAKVDYERFYSAVAHRQQLARILS